MGPSIRNESHNHERVAMTSGTVNWEPEEDMGRRVETISSQSTALLGICLEVLLDGKNPKKTTSKRRGDRIAAAQEKKQ